jgi:uncharacterized protein YkvS
VSAQEFADGLASVYTNVAANSQAVRRFYADNFGTGDLSLSAIFASALDPSTNPLV